ncbi:uncharacterized protein LOC130138004 [Syzygium oleosum]|uniref:uncharacterized protein LOC130138004 n=1 Tax=Syzygium oleosum TaxID=219896 RepID=UPI0024B9B2FF|nr:uncharacterized protein LOC130138004 [Syzygium oleosum]
MIHWYRQAKELSEGGTTDSCTFAQFRKADPPKFDGKFDPLKADGWIRSIEEIFRAENVHGNQKVNFATRYLEGEAICWWQGTRPALGGTDVIISWKDFTEAFNAQFFPESFQAKMRSDFANVSQGSSSVMEYAARFNQLSRFEEGFVASEKRRAEHFQRGLRPDIRSILTPFVLTTYKDVLDRAIRVEQDMLESGVQGTPQYKRFKPTDYHDSRTNSSKKRRDFNQSGRPKIQSNPGPCATCGKRHSGPCYRKTGACFLCGKIGHMARDCPAQKDIPGDSRVCFVCGQPGHLASACSMRKTASSAGRPQGNQERQKTTGKVFAITKEDAAASNAVVAGSSPRR